jgi:hypothetical protein
MTEKTKPFNGSILDEIISYFNNNIIICGSLSDYAYIGYDGIINDFDFIIPQSVFLQYLQIKQLDYSIVSEVFTLRRKKTQTYNKISYIGTYKNIYSIDIFLTDSEHETDYTYVNIASDIFYKTSKYNTYLIDSVETRKKRLQELLILANKPEDNPTEWLKTWKAKKISQVNKKLPLYNSKFPDNE